MTDEERYEEVCKPWMERFEKETKEKMAQIEKNAKETNAEILHILKGKNGDPGLVDDVRTIKEARAGWGRLGWIVVGATAAQIVLLLFNFLRTGPHSP
jgi:hypothetical protein